MNKVKSSVFPSIATLMFLGSGIEGAKAALFFHFEEVGGDVVMASSGSIDTSGLVSVSANTWGGTGVEENGNTDIMGGAEVGTGLDTFFSFNLGTDYSAWSSDNPWNSDFFDFNPTSGSHDFATYVRPPGGIQQPGLGISSGDLRGTIWTTDQEWIALGETFASMGLNEGTYTVIDDVSAESITFQIGVIPETSSALLLVLGGLSLSCKRRRG